MIGITKKRLYKIKKIKNQSRKIPKRKHKRKRKKKQNKSFRRRRKYNLKNKSLKKYKGGGFFTFSEMEKGTSSEITQEHRAKLARLKEAARNGEEVIIKQIIPVTRLGPDLYDINDMFFQLNDTTEKIELKNKNTTKLGDKQEKMLKNKLLGLQLRITRKNMDTITKPLYEVLNSILLKQSLEQSKGELQKLKNPLYKKDGPDNISEIKKKYPFHDIESENNGSQELNKLLMANKWYKTAFTNPEENYSVQSIEIASAFLPLGLESGMIVLSNKEEAVNPSSTMVVPPGVAVSSKRPTPPSPPQLQRVTQDISQKEETETDGDSDQTETDDETIVEDIRSAKEIADSAKELTQQDKLFDNFDKKLSFDDFEKGETYDAWLKEATTPETKSSLSTEQINKAMKEIKPEALDNVFQTIQSDGNEEYHTSNKDDQMQQSVGFDVLSDKDEKELSEDLGTTIALGIKAAKILGKMNSTEPLGAPIKEIEDDLNRLDGRSKARRSRTESIEMKDDDDDVNWQIRDESCTAGCKKCVAGVCKDAKKKLGSLGKKMKGKLKDYADASNDPDTGMRARLGKIAPKKYVKLPPADKPNVYFKATFQNDDWNLKLEKDGFAKDARSWLARVGIMSGGNITEIKSY